MFKSLRRVGTRRISHSEIESMQHCQLQHDLTYSGQVLGYTLTPKVAAPILQDGRAWGAMVAAWHITGDTVAAELEMEKSFGEDAQAMLDFGIPFEMIDAQLGEQRDLLRRIFAHYIATTTRIEGCHSPEQKFVVPLPSRTGRRSSNRYELDARIDLIKTDDYGDWVVEFKLRAQLTPLHILTRQPQIRRYTWAYEKYTGRQLAGIIVDETRKAAPNEPRMVKAKKMSEAQKSYRAECKAAGVEEDKERFNDLADRVPSHAKDQGCTVDAYRKNCADHGVEPEQETIDELALIVWGQRERVFVTPRELETTARELVSAGKQIHDFDSGAVLPIANVSPRTCGGCRFRDICGDLTNTEFIDSQFDRRPPRHEGINI